MSRINYNFMTALKKSEVNDINRVIFVSACEDVRLAGLIRDEKKAISALEKQYGEETDEKRQAEILHKMDEHDVLIEKYQGMKKANNAGANLQLFGIHTKAVNVDGLADKFGVADLFSDFVDYRNGIISREKYVQKWIACLKGFGMTAPDALFRKSAVKLADCVGDIATSSKKVVKGELTTATRMKGWLTVIMRTLTDDMRKCAGIERYDIETHDAQVSYKDSKVTMFMVIDK